MKHNRQDSYHANVMKSTEILKICTGLVLEVGGSAYLSSINFSISFRQTMACPVDLEPR